MRGGQGSAGAALGHVMVTSRGLEGPGSRDSWHRGSEEGVIEVKGFRLSESSPQVE